MRTLKSWLVVACYSLLTQLTTFFLSGIGFAALLMVYSGLKIEYYVWQAEAYGADLPEFITKNGASASDWEEFAHCFARVDWGHVVSGFGGAKMEASLLLQSVVKSVPILGWYGLVGFFIGGTLSLFVIQIATIYHLVRLRQGGEAIAEDLGCLELESSSLEGGLENLQSTAEEIAKEFGIPVPKIFVLHKESGINSFVVGRRAEDSVLVVTNGLKELDDIQTSGILAHEFSLIQSKNMVHSMRLLAVSMASNSVRYSSERLFRKGWQWFTCPSGNHFSAMFTLQWGMTMLCIGIALWPMGLASSLASAMFVAKLNRKRKIRFDRVAARRLGTSQPIAMSMRRILGHPQGSRIRCLQTKRYAQLMFAGAHGYSGGMFSTHPRLGQRILRVDRTWDGTPLVSEETLNTSGAHIPTDSGNAADTLDAANANVTDPRIATALAGIDSDIVALFQDNDAAVVTLPALTCFDMSNRDYIYQLCDGQYTKYISSLLELLSDTTASERFALMEMLLQHVSPDNASSLAPMIEQLASFVSEKDWSVQGWLRIFTDAINDPIPCPATQFNSFAACVRPLLEVTSIGMTFGSSGAIAELRAGKIWAAVELNAMPILDVDAYGFDDLDEAVETLRLAPLRSRQTLLIAFADALSDGLNFGEQEAAFLRYLAHRFGIPTALLPRMLPTTQLGKLAKQSAL